jgi:NADH-quinone oxidoreductase subunit L
MVEAANTLSVLIVLFPLAGALSSLLLGRWLKGAGCGVVSTSMAFFSFVAAVLLAAGGAPFRGEGVQVDLFHWIVAGNFSVDFSLLLDKLSVVMAMVVAGVGAFIHLYATWYMKDDPGARRFFGQFSLFLLSMLVLVTGSNFLMLFLGWEGVGLCSYLLIGFWHHKDSAARAANKAFIVNRVGDLSFILGVALIFAKFGELGYREVFEQAPHMFETGDPLMVAITLLLLGGALGKSAQLPLHTWLPDAMEGPTPVSALIHAATMVTAGVYMLVRCNALLALSPLTMTVVTAIGLLTALYAGTVAIVQTDMKRVLAYSTISQLGFMFLAVGLGAFSTGIFHLANHAFFKALLFLVAGVAIHASNEEPNIFKMSSIRPQFLTRNTLLFGGLALAGIFPFSGFFSKEGILDAALADGKHLVWFGALVAAFITSLYTFRLYFVLLNRKSDDDHHHGMGKPAGITLSVLAVMSLIAGILGLALGWFDHLMHGIHGPHAPHIGFMTILALLVSVFGVYIAYLLWGRGSELPEILSEVFGGLKRFLFKGYYFDELYDYVFVRPANFLAKAVWRGGDLGIIDGFLNGMARCFVGIGSATRRLQAGLISFYVLGMLVGLLAAVFLLTTMS